MDKEVLAFIILIIIFIISVIIFSFIYYSYNDDDTNPEVRAYSYSLYTAITIQTGVGLSNPPNIHNKSLQYWVMAQSVIAYLLIIGAVFIAVKLIFRNEDTFEKRIEREIGSMKALMVELHSKNKIKSKK
jgi:hypothetical protein